MKNKFLIFGVLSLFLVSAFAVTSAFAYSNGVGFGNKNLPKLTQEERQQKMAEMQEQMKQKQAEIKKILEAKDYDGWVKFHEVNGKNPKMTEGITKENFAEFAEAKLMMEKGREKLQALGIQNFKQMGMNKKCGGFKRGGFNR